MFFKRHDIHFPLYKVFPNLEKNNRNQHFTSKLLVPFFFSIRGTHNTHRSTIQYMTNKPKFTLQRYYSVVINTEAKNTSLEYMVLISNFSLSSSTSPTRFFWYSIYKPLEPNRIKISFTRKIAVIKPIKLSRK